MAKRSGKKKSSRKRNRQRVEERSNVEKGFDFGEQLPVMALPATDFNQALTNARVISCGYGYERMEGFPAPIPSITLIGQNRDGFDAAFKQFALWGCEEDGDVVDISMMLKLDGTYRMWIGPNAERSMYRLMPQSDLYRPLMFGVSWVKQFDSTQGFVHKLKRYCESAISPVSIHAAIGSTIIEVNPNKVLDDLPKLVKFELEIIDERESRDHPKFHVEKGSTFRRKEEPVSPERFCKARKRSLDLAFPVSRERVRRSGLIESVREFASFANVSETQIVQAAINLIISSELVPGDRHYSKLTGDILRKIWDHVATRFETANDDDKPSNQEPLVVCRQIELDLKHVMTQYRIATAGRGFVELQEHFRSKGYIDD